MDPKITTSPEPKKELPIMTGGLEDPPIPEKIESKPGEKANEGPVYKTFVGELKTQEELSSYIKNLEEMVVQAKAHPGQATAPTAEVLPPKPVQTAKDRFSELIFSNPDQAFDIVRQDVLQEVNKNINAKQQEEIFWEEFYTNNEDLKNNKPLIDYIVRAKWEEIKKLPNKKATNDFLVKEASQIIDPIKKQYSGVETKLDSGAATVFGASGESFTPPNPSGQVGPQSLTAQLLSMNARRKKK